MYTSLLLTQGGGLHWGPGRSLVLLTSRSFHHSSAEIIPYTLDSAAMTSRVNSRNKRIGSYILVMPDAKLHRR
jgi:hypothetical protein